jgi:hypothetical protein
VPVSVGGSHDTEVIVTLRVDPVSEQVKINKHVVASNEILTVLIVAPTRNDPENVLPAFESVTVAGQPLHPVYIVSVMVFG